MITIARHTPLSLHVVRLSGELTAAQFFAAYAAIARERIEAETKGLTLRDVRAGQRSLFEVAP